MIKAYINNSDRTEDIEQGTLSRSNEIQQRADSVSFSIFRGSKPSENQDIKIFVCDEVAAISGTTVTLAGKFERNTNKFFQGQSIFLKINESAQFKAEIASYDEDALEIVLAETPPVTVLVGDLIGWIFFGGIISRVGDRNMDYKSNLEYDVEAVDYSKIFDKKLISDSWIGKDGRYIINDFVNTTVNYNYTIDNLSYADNTAVQAVWAESGSANNPTVDTVDYLEDESSLVMSWTGTSNAILIATPTAFDLTAWTLTATGLPTDGQLMLWANPDDFTKIDNISVRIGSSASDYLEVVLEKVKVNDWQYLAANLAAGTVTGTPDWSAIDYLAIIVDPNATSSIKLNGLRLNATNSFTCKNVNATLSLTEFRAPQVKPTSFLQTLAKNFKYVWWIDYEHDIHFVSAAIEVCPVEFTDSSNNYSGLNIEVDQSQIGNRVIVRGGERTSIATYSEIREGNNAQREWLMKSKFNNLEIFIDDSSSTSTAGVGTTTTNITITAHGLSNGDYIINRTRDNAVREVIVVNANNISVETVPGQTNGDTISYFDTQKTIGIEGLVDETSVDYVYNSNEKSVRSTSITPTLDFDVFIKFSYKERLQIQFQYLDPVSSNALKALGLGDGIFDLDPVTDFNIKDTTTALALAQAKINDYRNPVITGGAKTDRDGIKAGQTIHVQDAVRSIDTNFIVQSVKSTVKVGEYGDYIIHSISFGTTLFGIIEFYQKLLAQKNALDVGGSDEPVQTYISGSEDLDFVSADSLATNGGFLKANQNETIEASEANSVVVFDGSWQYEPSSGQPLPTRYNLSSYS